MLYPNTLDTLHFYHPEPNFLISISDLKWQFNFLGGPKLFIKIFGLLYGPQFTKQNFEYMLYAAVRKVLEYFKCI